MTVRFSNKLVAELIQSFWAALQAGEFLTDAAAVAHTHRHRGLAWLREAGRVRPRRGRDLRGRYLSFGEREEIALGLARGGIDAPDRGPVGPQRVDDLSGGGPQPRRAGPLSR